MELTVRDGDYCLDETGGLREATGAQEVMARVLFRLTARRGGLPFLPELGSHLHLLLHEKPSARPSLARRYVAQALEQERDLTVNEVTFLDTETGGNVVVQMEWKGEPLSVTVELT